MNDKLGRILDIYKDVKFPNLLSNAEYKELHTAPLVPLDIKIDTDQFNKDIVSFEQHFEQWGEKFLDVPRYGAALVNEDGKFKNKDPANYPNDEWNERYPEKFLAEFQMTATTPLFDIPSLLPLKIFKDHIYRSNILKWGKDAYFTPHIDTILPSPYLRLWGTTDSSKIDVRFYSTQTGQLEKFNNIETGRMYLVDTSIVHDAQCTADFVYQYFICLSPLAKDQIKTKVVY